MAQATRDQWKELDPELNLEIDFSAEIPPFALLQARRLIEPEAAALAAVNASDEELAGIREAFERNVQTTAKAPTPTLVTACSIFVLPRPRTIRPMP